MTINNIDQIQFNNTYYKINNEYLDSEWVYNSNLPVWNFSSSGSTTSHLIDLSTFLPNDNNEYMLLLQGDVYVFQDNKTNEIMVSPARDVSNYDMDIRLANCITRVAAGQADSSFGLVKIDTNRKMVIRCGGTASADNGNARIKVLAYRRLSKSTTNLTSYLDVIQRGNYQYDLGDTARDVRCLQGSDNPIINSSLAKNDSVTLDLSIFLPDTSNSYLCQFSIRETHKTAKATDESGIIYYTCTSALGNNLLIMSRYEQATSSSTDRADGLFYVILTPNNRSITINNGSDRTNNSIVLYLNWIRKIPKVPMSISNSDISSFKLNNSTYTLCPTQHLDQPWNWLSEGYTCFGSTIGSHKSTDIDLTTWIANNCYSNPTQGASLVGTENRLIEIMFTTTCNTGSASDSEQTCNILGTSCNSSEVVLQSVNFCYLKSQKSSGSTQRSGRSFCIYFERRPQADNKFILTLENWAVDKSGTISVYITAWRWINTNNRFNLF